MVEHTAVNRGVVGSSPTRGARALSESKPKAQLEVSGKPVEPLMNASEAKREFSNSTELEHLARAWECSKTK